MGYIPPKRRKLTKHERQLVYKKCNGHCAYCGKEITIGQMQVDHIIPMEFYPSYDCYGIDIDVIDNMLPSCRSCNNYKRTFSLEQFRSQIERCPTILKGESATYRNAVRFSMVIPNPHHIQFYFETLPEIKADINNYLQDVQEVIEDNKKND